MILEITFTWRGKPRTVRIDLLFWFVVAYLICAIIRARTQEIGGPAV